MTQTMRLQSVRLRNFKAIIDSKVVKLGPLTVFIGNNGAGKSSLIEGLETYQSIVRDGLDVAMQRWMGIEHARHKGQEAKERAGKLVNPIAFDLAIGESPRKARKVELEANNDPAANRMFIGKEMIGQAGDFIDRNLKDIAQTYGPGRSILSAPLAEFDDLARHINGWQFLTLSPERMGLPVPQQRTGGGVRLARDGSNIADFLLDLRRLDQLAFEGIVETMAYVLPYARDLQPAVTSEIERKAWLQLTEADFKVPGWMLSTGTLRLLALLALLRHPSPPPLIAVEEIENGLDPRSIHLVIDEIRTAVQSGRTQVVLTTHSPYFLNLLPLQTIVLVERNESGSPTFWRPADIEEVQEWGKRFAPGELYTTGRFKKG
ncbi:AAA family ATPase [Desulfuromonas sp. TF]|uniref:AAA family ATPase n=1 Tax=Desulfuromonas sp. TF TaxID=1232410 RepID=UPI00040D4104|nr:AAA family ATPase [Desulfuromonas sp. TF]